LLLIARCRYGSVRKKSRLRADATAVASAAVRPPNSPTRIVRARNTKVKFEAMVKARTGTRAMPSSTAASGPTPM
jgi:hypothetical protein